MKLTASSPTEIADCSIALSYVPSLNANGITCRSDEGEHLATLLFDFWTINAVQMHMWIEKPKALDGGQLVRDAFNYVLKTGRELVIGVTPGDNTLSLRFQHALGFIEKYRVVDGWAKGIDMVISEKRLETEIKEEAA